MSGDKKYWLETYGCQMNFAESNALELALQDSGLVPAESADKADYAIINTCSVRKTAENRIWGRIGYFQHLKESKEMKLIIAGCMAERLGDEFLKEAPAVDHVMGTNDKLRIAALLRGANDERDQNYSFTSSYYKEGDVKSFVPIMNGCNNFCSYCIVPYVRGREVSRSIESILEEVEFLDSKGVKEITLLGQNVNSYNYNQITFSELLLKVIEKTNSIRWIRFESPHPKDFSDELIEVIATQPKIAKHLHIPMQSGSTSVLRRMNRKYSKEHYLNLIDKVKKAVSNVTITTDVMVGFPGESEEDFHETLQVMEDVNFLEAFMYYFNPREGTKAVTMENQIPSEIKMARLQLLIDQQRKRTVKAKEKRATGIVEVLVEGPSKKNPQKLLGKTEHDEMVVFDPVGELKVGDFVFVELEKLVGNTYNAHQVT